MLTSTFIKKSSIKLLVSLVMIVCSSLLNNVQSQAILNADGPGNTYELINNILSPGYTAVEAPDQCTSHPAFGRHVAEVFDATLNQFVFEFYIHVPTTFPVTANTADNDRCVSFDRQRVEIKTYDSSPDSLKGTTGETVTYKWRFRLPAGFQPSPNFTHIHQVKAVGGDDDDPLFTLTARAGSPNSLQLIYVDASANAASTVQSANLSSFLGTWVEVTEQIKLGAAGTYSITIKRVSDGATLLTYSNNNILTIRSDNTFIRPKWGIYRSLQNPSFLRDDSIRIANISIFEGLAPITPTAVNASAISSSQINITWTDATNETSFIVERSLDGVTGWTPIGITTRNATSFASTGLTANTFYYYRVRAENPAGTSAYSTVVNAKTNASAVKIILKLDDFVVKNNACAGSPTLDYILTKKIKATIGAVSNKFDGSALAFLAPYLNANNNSNEKLLEVWHHGFDHINPEFIGTGYTYQKAHFENADQQMLAYLRLQMKSFGAPFNHNDAVTNTVLSENTNYKVTMFNDPAPAAPILNLTNRVNMENGTGNPEYAFFVTNYNALKTTFTDYMVLQGHPNVWSASQLTQFGQIVDFLISEGCEFVQPYEYYLTLNPSTPQPIQSQTITFNALANKIVGDADFNAGATASSTLPVLYNSSNANVATIVSGNIRIVGAGTTIITASQAGNATYKPANYVSQTLIVSAVDYRSASTSGNWNTPASWEVRDATSGAWTTATTVPTAINNVYVQSGHTITVNIANVYCNDLHINTAGILAIGTNIANVSGKIRAYTGAAVIGASASDGAFYTGQTSTTAPASTMITTSTGGLLKFVGITRNITNTGEWGGSGTTNFAEFALDAGAIGTLATGMKFRTITISSGSIVLGNASIAVGSTSGNGNLIIKNGAKLTTARAWTGTAGSQAIQYNSASKMGTLQIDNGGTLELLGAATAVDCTTFTNNGTVIFSGASQSLLTTSAATNVGIGSAIPSNYTNLIIDGTGTITVAGTLSVNAGTLATGNNNLTLGGTAVFAGGTVFSINGGVTDFAGKSVTLQSTVSASGASDNASIAAITGTLNNASNVTVQQYIPGGFRKYRFLGHPFSTAIPLSQLTDNIDITGAGGSTNGFTTTATNNPSAYSYITANGNGASYDAGWNAFTDATTNSWLKGQGIRVLIRGTKSQVGSLSGGTYTPNEVTLDMTGSINTGSVVIPLSPLGSGGSQGFNLVGNPFPSAVDVGAVLTAASNIGGNSFYIRNPQIGSYTTINPIPASYILPANSSFFVKATAATNLNFAEANKNICTNCATVFRTALKTFVQLKALKNGVEYDNVYLSLDDNYSEKYETKHDALKLTNDELSLYTIASDKQKLAADYRSISSTTIIPIGIALPTAYGKQQYTLSVSDYSMLLGVKLYLHDKLTNAYIEIKNDATYTLEIDPANPNAVGENRLEIVLSKGIVATLVDATDDVLNVNITTTNSAFIVNYKAPLLADATINLYNANGQLLQAKNIGLQQQAQVSLPTTTLTKGLYFIEVIVGKNRVAKKAMKF
jgi:hypothetical protein